MLECVVNISEGRRHDVLARIGASAGADLLDLHHDADHHRSVLTLVGEQAARSVAATAVAELDLPGHQGAHPRFGVVDVVPFVPLGAATMAQAVEARDRFGAWLADEWGVPSFCYGPERTLPTLRRQAFSGLRPDFGPDHPHPRAGAVAIGARGVLVAYNLWLAEPDLDLARQLARQLRGPAVRALGLAVGPHVQVSMNLVEPDRVGPAEVYDLVAARTAIERAELVGLIPASVLDAVEHRRWESLGLSADATIEARLAIRADAAR